MATKQVKLPVSGMTCAACAYHVQRVLTAANGVSDVYVSRSPAYASVRYDPAQVTLIELVKQVYREGYGIVQDTTEFTILDTFSPENVPMIEGAIREHQAVLNVVTNLAGQKVQVTYIPGLGDPDAIIQGLELAGYKVLNPPQPAQESGWMGFFKNIFGRG